MTLRRTVVFMMMIALDGAALAAPSAEELFNQGQTAYTSSDYAVAVARWNESYALSREPELLFNIAQALRLEGRCVEALATYRRFVAIAPGSEQRPLADEFVRELMPRCGATAAPRSAGAVETVETHRRGDGKAADADGTRPAGLTIAGLAVAGVGVVSVATGLYFGHRASSLREEVADACPGTGCDWAVLGAKDAEGHRAETRQYLFAGIGAAAIIGGGVIYWLALRERRLASASVALAPGRGGAAVTWSGSW